MPRHYTVSPFCTACRLRVAACVCAVAPRLPTATRLVVMMHAAEWRKAANTGHLTRLALRDVDVRLQGRPHQPLSDAGIDPASALVLFPGRGAEPLTPALVESLTRPVTLVVPDGNWRQAKNMMRRVPLLNAARPVRLDGPCEAPPGLRRNRRPDRRSTFAAIAQALGVLEGPETEARLLAFFRLFLERKQGTERHAGPGGGDELPCIPGHDIW